MVLLLSFVAAAHAACQVVQTPTERGLTLSVTAQAEPLSCRRLTLRSAGELRVASVRRGKVRVPRDHVGTEAGEVRIGVPELQVGEVVTVDVEVAGAGVEVILGEPPPPAAAAAETHTTWTVAVDPKHPGWGFADPAHASTRREVATVAPDGHRVTEVGGAPAQGRMTIPPGSFVLDLPGGDVSAWGGPGVTVEVAGSRVRFVAPAGGEIAWRVSQVAGASVIPDGRTFVDGLDWRFVQASLPEPAIPVRYASVVDADVLARALYADVQALTPGWLPGPDGLHPRQLNRAWRSGWATPVEAGLILDRLLRQGRMTAAWVLTGADPEKQTLTGYDRLLVAAQVGEREVLLDPACAVCAFDEVSTAVAGKPAVGATDVVPLSTGRLVRKLSLVGTEFAATVHAEGAAALWLREAAWGLGEARRSAILAERLGFPGGRVIGVEGLDTRGGPVKVELSAQRPPRPVFDGDPPWVGGWADE